MGKVNPKRVEELCSESIKLKKINAYFAILKNVLLSNVSSPRKNFISQMLDATGVYVYTHRMLCPVHLWMTFPLRIYPSVMKLVFNYR